LRQALFRLRRALGQDALVGDGEDVSLATGVVDCDVTHFEALIREGSRASLAGAADLYRGRLLEDMAITEEAWADWVGSERQRLEALALDAMTRLAEHELSDGKPEAALKAAQRATALNNLREDAHRAIIRALAAAGRKADALKHYEEVAAVLKRELDVEPDAATVAVAAELRKPQPATAAGLGTGALSPGARMENRPLPLPDRPSIAVLPFANMSGNPEQEYFADGMVDDILMALSRVRWLFVIARQSSFIYKVRVADVQQIGRELGVRYVVEGSVRKAGNRVRIVAQLIETETGAHIWADRYEGDLRDIFTLQDEITERIVSALEMNVRDAEIRRARAKPTDSLTAYDLYLRALPTYFGQTEVDYRRTQVLLGKALEGNPEYAEALGTLTDSVAGGTLQGWQESWTRGVDEACRLAGRALAAGPDNSTCVVSAAFTYGVLSYRFEEAFELANRAVMLHPNSVLVRHRAAAVYAVCGESDKAIAQCEAACRMNPLDSKKAATATFTTLSCALYFARRYEECIHAGRRALAFAPQSNTARKYVAVSLAQLGRTGEARAEIAELLKHQPDASLSLFQLHSFRHKWMHELHLEGLRKAGLRES
ncbi:MAG TPA: BTAD domain-containing putative transcriptional regulator, partial [Hyphomicrobiaceae bacterium]|nr:BTAD domain-containing putative transcriptional regulator [Hyphomicrobiaceae bacterium]